jgi:hypothetical protein
MGTVGRTILKIANNWRAVLALYLGSILTGAVIFSLVETGRSLWDGIWWAFITGLTIGYGDVYPVTAVGRITGIVLAHVVILIIAPMIIAHMTLKLIVDSDEFTDEEQKTMQADLRDTRADLHDARQELAGLRTDMTRLIEHLGANQPPRS